jgi:hypothetical protein
MHLCCVNVFVQSDLSQEQSQTPPVGQPLFGQQHCQIWGSSGTAAAQKTAHTTNGLASGPSAVHASTTAAAASKLQVSQPVLQHLSLDVASTAELNGRNGRAATDPSARVGPDQRVKKLFSSYSTLI